MNPGKLDVVKQEMERINIDILGISELRWTGVGELNSDDHYIYYCGHEFEQTLRDSEEQGSLSCCSSQGQKELDVTEQLNSNNVWNTVLKMKDRMAVGIQNGCFCSGPFG